MSVQKAALYQLEHRKHHHGRELHAEQPVLFDHAERAPSLLHHRINTCSSAIVVTIANKAAPAIKKKLNEVLLRLPTIKSGLSRRRRASATSGRRGMNRALFLLLAAFF
eukprot:630796-Pleurochrysis_carterae.AAC.1